MKINSLGGHSSRGTLSPGTPVTMKINSLEPQIMLAKHTVSRDALNIPGYIHVFSSS